MTESLKSTVPPVRDTVVLSAVITPVSCVVPDLTVAEVVLSYSLSFASNATAVIFALLIVFATELDPMV